MKAFRDAELAERFTLLAESFRGKVPGKLSEMQLLVDRLCVSSADTEAWQRLGALAHGLSGNAGSFGLGELGVAARAVEQLVAEARPLSRSVSGVELDRIRDAVMGLAQFVTNVSLTPESLGSAGRRPTATMSGLESLVYVVDADTDVAKAVALHLKHFGYGVEVFAEPSELLVAVRKERPRAIVVDMAFPGEAGIRVVRELSASGDEPIPVVFMSARTDLAARVEAVRAGGRAYVVKPVYPGALLEKLETLFAEEQPNPYRVLVVDDEEEVTTLEAAALGAAGMRCSAVNDPMRLLERIAEFDPEIILMDLHMPGVSGIELGAALRQDERLVGIPIVFLSTDAELDKHIHALQIGADDFLIKPIASEYLVRSVAARVERARKLAALMDRDSMTGLLNHSRIEEALGRELVRASRQGRPLSVAMIDLDHFKAVNDTHGHLVGDSVLRALALMLKRRLRRSDLTGRWGGEEFVVIMPDTDAEAAQRTMDALCTRFGRVTHTGPLGEFRVTFSAGLSEALSDDTAASLLARADSALYDAKERGRDTTVIAQAHRFSGQPVLQSGVSELASADFEPVTGS